MICRVSILRGTYSAQGLSGGSGRVIYSRVWCACVKGSLPWRSRTTIFFTAEEAGAYCHEMAPWPPGLKAEEGLLEHWVVSRTWHSEHERPF